MRKIILIAAALFCGMFSCQDEEKELLYMVYGETGCANPWEMSGDEDKYIDNIRAYLYEQKVWAFSIDIKNELPDDALLCHSCFCWTGRNIYIRIPPEQQEAAEEIGFVEVEE